MSCAKLFLSFNPSPNWLLIFFIPAFKTLLTFSTSDSSKLFNKSLPPFCNTYANFSTFLPTGPNPFSSSILCFTLSSVISSLLIETLFDWPPVNISCINPFCVGSAFVIGLSSICLGSTSAIGLAW